MSINADLIKQEIDPLDFYRHELPDALFKNHGWNEGGLCPFHSDKHTGSFYIHLETGGFNCFSCGEKGGDIIAFTMALYGLNFPEALAKLTDEWGL